MFVVFSIGLYMIYLSSKGAAMNYGAFAFFLLQPIATI